MSRAYALILLPEKNWIEINVNNTYVQTQKYMYV